MNVIDQIEQQHIGQLTAEKQIPHFRPGDTLRVNVKVVEGNFCRIMTWYDNEWGFANRMSDTAIKMASLG